MKPSDFLPSFFKHVKRAVVPGQGQVDDFLEKANDPLKVFKMPGSGEGVPLANLLAPDQKPVAAVVPPVKINPEIPKVTIPYKVPSVDTATPPLPYEPSAPPVIDPADIPRASGHVYSDRRGRPKPFNPELDPSSDEKTIAVNKAYQNYDPAAQPAKGWRKWVPTMISGALRGFGNGGVGGAIFGAAEGGIGGALDPSRANREWQRKRLGETGPIVTGIQKERKAQADIEEQQAEAAQRRAAPGIAAADVIRKREYDQKRLEIQQDVAEGRKSAAKATIELRSLELKQRAEEGKLNRESREKIALMRPNTADAAAAEGEALAASTTAAAGALKQELDQHKGQLIENEKSIATKEGLWQSQAAQIVAADPSIKLKDALEMAKAADPDVQKGIYDQTVNNTKALRDALALKEKEYRDMQGDIRQGSAKAARGTTRTSAVTPQKDGKYHYTPEQIRAALKPGQNYDEVYAKLKADKRVVIDE